MAWNEGLTQLKEILAELYDDIASSKEIVAKAQLPDGNIRYDTARSLNWSAILKEADKRKKVESIVGVAKDDFEERKDELEEALRLYHQVDKVLEAEIQNRVVVDEPTIMSVKLRDPYFIGQKSILELWHKFFFNKKVVRQWAPFKLFYFVDESVNPLPICSEIIVKAPDFASSSQVNYQPETTNSGGESDPAKSSIQPIYKALSINPKGKNNPEEFTLTPNKIGKLQIHIELNELTSSNKSRDGSNPLATLNLETTSEEKRRKPWMIVFVILVLLIIAIGSYFIWGQNCSSATDLPFCPDPEIVVSSPSNSNVQTPSLTPSPVINPTTPAAAPISEDDGQSNSLELISATETLTPTTEIIISPTPSPTSTATPSDTPTLTVTPTMIPIQLKVLLSSIGLRIGPGSAYNIKSENGGNLYLYKDDIVKVLARHGEIDLWFFVERPDGENGWVTGDESVEIIGVNPALILTLVPTADPTLIPPAPTATPTFTPPPSSMPISTPTSGGGGGGGGSGPTAAPEKPIPDTPEP